MENQLKKIVIEQKKGHKIGIYSACSANPFVIEAVLRRGKKDNACVLIESTANQCDQFGGYTGMKPKDFMAFVLKKANEIGFDTHKLFLGGDHLGPLTFCKYEEEKAMELADELIDSYVSAGFTKIHIDTSMKVASDDPDTRLSDEKIAKRGARLAKVAETAYQKLLKQDPNAVHPVYVIGSEVPIPGGSTTNNNTLEVTKVEDFKNSLNAFKKAFQEEGLEEAMNNVIAFVVQPGVEEQDAGCVEYDREKAKELCASIQEFPNIVFEGHSTDYQTRFSLRQLVEDGVAILKVGPALTYAMREGLFALSFIEEVVMDKEKRSNFIDVLEQVMLKDDKYWKKHYQGTEKEKAIKRRYSFSDRCRYYFSLPEVEKSLIVLFENLKDGVPLNLLSQYMPIQYQKVRWHQIENKPLDLILDRIDNTLDDYLYASKQEELF